MVDETGTYYLKLIGQSDEKISVPNGKTTIGRGPFLKCSDKKVSRNHAELELNNDALFITPKHVNPCFYYEKGVKESCKPLEKHKRHKLNSGDWISLLPDLLYYEVILEKNEISSASALKVSENVVKNTSPTLPDAADANGSAASKPDKVDENLKFPKTELENNEAKELQVPQRKRTLPDWLIEAAKAENSSSTGDVAEKPVAKKRAVKRKDASEPSTSSSSKARNEKPVDSPSDNEDKDYKNGNETKSKKLSGADANKNFELSDNSDEDNDGKKVNVMVDKLSDKHKNDTAKNTSVSEEKGKMKASDVRTDTKKRKPCEFGKKCYRKNPVHLEECSHPGDSDYTSDVDEARNNQASSDDDDDRPECEYGTDCYRKNPQHRKEYKHTKRPERKAAKEAKRKSKKRDSGDEDNSYDSSFIDDSDRDSNYTPDDEDIKVLEKEAKEFMKNKKLYTMNT